MSGNLIQVSPFLASLMGETPTVDSNGDVVYADVDQDTAISTLLSSNLRDDPLRELGVLRDNFTDSKLEEALADPVKYMKAYKEELRKKKVVLAATYNKNRVDFANNYSLSYDKAAAKAKDVFDAQLKAAEAELNLKYPTSVRKEAQGKIDKAQLTI